MYQLFNKFVLLCQAQVQCVCVLTIVADKKNKKCLMKSVTYFLILPQLIPDCHTPIQKWIKFSFIHLEQPKKCS